MATDKNMEMYLLSWYLQASRPERCLLAITLYSILFQWVVSNSQIYKKILVSHDVKPFESIRLGSMAECAISCLILNDTCRRFEVADIKEQHLTCNLYDDTKIIRGQDITLYSSIGDCRYEKIDRYCYQFNMEYKNKDDARAFCEDQGLLLAQLETAEKFRVLANYLRDNKDKGLSFWLGGEYKDGIWKWMPSNVEIMFGWAKDQPSSGGLTPSVAMWGWQGFNLDDDGTQNEIPFICED